MAYSPGKQHKQDPLASGPERYANEQQYHDSGADD
jgi:hypothetical protein